MNPFKSKPNHTRNITPNFIRFKHLSGSKKSQQDNNQQQQQQQGNSNTNVIHSNNHQIIQDEKAKNSQRSSSRASQASRCSFQVYQKRILNMNKLSINFKFTNNLENTLSIKRRNVEDSNSNSIDPSKRKQNNNFQVSSRRTNSNDKKTQQITNINTNMNIGSSQTRENLVYVGGKTGQRQLDRKRSSGSGKILKPPSRDKYSNPKRTQDSLQKQEQRAKLMNVQLINTLMNHQQVPNYMNKLKIKKSQTQERKKTAKRKFLNCNIQIKGQEDIKNYQIFGELGKGAYGLVRMGIDKRSSQKVAIKVYQKKRLDEANKIKNLQRQIDILSSLDHPIVAKLIQTIQTQNQIFIVMEYGGANSLYNYLLSKPQHRLEQSQAKQFFQIIAQTLAYLHDKNIVHRDIKAQNILLNRHKHLKLIDFGFSLYSKPPSTIDTFCGTPTYMAPQIVSKKDHVPVYTDMWSLGILFYVMLQGNYPFRAKSQNELFEKIRKGKFQYIHDDISPKSKALIEALLKVNPLERLTVKQVLGKEYSSWYSTQ